MKLGEKVLSFLRETLSDQHFQAISINTGRSDLYRTLAAIDAGVQVETSLIQVYMAGTQHSISQHSLQNESMWDCHSSAFFAGIVHDRDIASRNGSICLSFVTHLQKRSRMIQDEVWIRYESYDDTFGILCSLNCCHGGYGQL